MTAASDRTSRHVRPARGAAPIALADPDHRDRRRFEAEQVGSCDDGLPTRSRDEIVPSKHGCARPSPQRRAIRRDIAQPPCPDTNRDVRLWAPWSEAAHHVERRLRAFRSAVATQPDEENNDDRTSGGACRLQPRERPRTRDGVHSRHVGGCPSRTDHGGGARRAGSTSSRGSAEVGRHVGEATTCRIVESGGPIETVLLTELHRSEKELWCVGSHARGALWRDAPRQPQRRARPHLAHVPVVLVGPHATAAPSGQRAGSRARWHGAERGHPPRRAADAVRRVRHDPSLAPSCRGRAPWTCRVTRRRRGICRSAAAKVPTIDHDAVDYDVLHGGHPAHDIADYVGDHPDVGMVALATRGLSGRCPSPAWKHRLRARPPSHRPGTDPASGLRVLRQDTSRWSPTGRPPASSRSRTMSANPCAVCRSAVD